MSNRTHYVEVEELHTRVDTVPFSVIRDTVPYGFIVGRLYGPYSEAGAARVAGWALSEVSDDIVTYPSGARYAIYSDGKAARVVTVYSAFPWGKWREKKTARRNYPRAIVAPEESDADTYSVIDTNGDVIDTYGPWWMAARRLRESGASGWRVIDSMGATQATYPEGDDNV